jgi:chromosome segregation ATPase
MNTAEGNDGNHTGAAAEAQRETSSGNVDKIRDILFGSQMRDYEQRFVRLEESLRKESADLRESTRRRLDALESYVKKELESLQSRLRTEKDERTESAASIFRKIAEFEDQTSQAQRELRTDLLQQSKELGDAIHTRNEELTTLLERRVQELRHAKTDRTALANLLTEVAMRLTDDFHVPGAE